MSSCAKPKSDDTKSFIVNLVVCVFTSGSSFGELGSDGDVGVDGRTRNVLSDGCIDVQKVGFIGLVKRQKRQGSIS